MTAIVIPTTAARLPAVGAGGALVLDSMERPATGAEILDHKMMHLPGVPGLPVSVPMEFPELNETCPNSTVIQCDLPGDPCHLCNGSGVVPRQVFAAVQQHRYLYPGGWGRWMLLFPHEDLLENEERRWAVVSQCQNPQKLLVEDEMMARTLMMNGHGFLTPGQLVVMGDWVDVPEPITTMECEHTTRVQGNHVSCGCGLEADVVDGYAVDVALDHTVPLDLTLGQPALVELAPSFPAGTLNRIEEA